MQLAAMAITIIKKKKEDDGKCRSPTWPFPPKDQHLFNPMTETCVVCSLPYAQWKDKTRIRFELPDSMKKTKIKEEIGL